ncbi:MAG: DUF4349 domain-containing protein [Saprospiraceae bacterium]|nr:DUF4349 domain-containing protein [Saprospiraceae bacterium]
MTKPSFFLPNPLAPSSHRLPFSLLLLLSLLFSCQSAERQAPRQSAPEPTTSAAPSAERAQRDAVSVAADETGPQSPEEAPVQPGQMSSAAAALSDWDMLKKLVRTSEVKFRTPDVARTTLAIEDIVRQNGGFVLENKLENSVSEQYTTQVSPDSVLQTTVLIVANSLTFRVPAAQLDTTLRSIGRYVDLLEYRRVHARDVSLEHLEQQLIDLRTRLHQQQVEDAIGQTKAKLGDITAAQDKALVSRAAADAAKLEQLKLEDAVALSTVQVDLRQQPLVRKEMLPNRKPEVAWRPGMGARLGEALLGGWDMALGLLLLVLRFWPLWILLAGGVWTYKKKWWPQLG